MGRGVHGRLRVRLERWYRNDGFIVNTLSE